MQGATRKMVKNFLVGVLATWLVATVVIGFFTLAPMVIEEIKGSYGDVGVIVFLITVIAIITGLIWASVNLPTSSNDDFDRYH